MNTPRAAAIAVVVGAASCAALLTAAGCQDSSSTPEPGPSSRKPFTPQGCEFEVAGRPEFKAWRADGIATGKGTANIRWVRLGLGGELTPGPGYADPSTSIAIAWQTDDGEFGTEVRWGTSPDPASWSAQDSATGITWLTPEGDLAPNGDERMHEVYLCGLTPATTYYYQVRGGAEASDVYSFTTVPDASSEVRIAVTGDSRGQHRNAWQVLQRRVLERGVTMQLFSGDMVDLAPSQVEWEQWLDKAWRDDDGALSSLGQALMVPTHGNHENHTPLYYGNVVVPQSPRHQPDYLEHFYSFNVGPVHVIVVDDFAVVSPTIDPLYGDVLKQWLEADLAAAEQERAVRPWIIAVHHHAEYSSSNHGLDSDVLRGRAFFVPIWDAHHVDAVFVGHDHNYERTYALIGGSDVSTPTMDPTGTTYIICAGSGADGYSNGSSPFTASSAEYKDTTHLGLYGVLLASSTTLRWQPYWIDASGDNPVEPETLLRSK